jgi:hypothetical protein
MRILSFLPTAASEPTIFLFVNFMTVVNVPTSSANCRANRRALSATEQRASDCPDAGAGRRAPNRFACGVLAIMMAVAITVVSGSIIITSVGSVLRHRAWGSGDDG